VKVSALKSAKQRTARERIAALFEQALVRPEYAKRYVSLARKMSSRFKVSVPQKWRTRFCKKCSAFLVPGKNSKIRMRAGKMVISCLECAGIRRIPTKR